MNVSYQYNDLDLSTQAFRLLQIVPSQEDGTVHCTLREALIGDGDYVALSYMWHPPGLAKEVRCTIVVDGKPFQIASNLFDFLNEAQAHLGETDLWIDALCINQSNGAEQNHQVSQMHQVYSNASSVLVWLGNGSANETEFLDFILSITKDVGYTIMKQYAVASKTAPGSDSLVDGIRSVFANSYWSRRWIVQELLLARSIDIMLGSRRVPWGSFFGPAGSFEHTWSMHRAGGEHMTRVRDARDNPDGISFASANLAELIVYFEDQECTDPRDRVYAMLGIADLRDGFTVDYELDMKSVVQYALRRVNIPDVLMAFALLKSVGLSETSELDAGFLAMPFSDDQITEYIDIVTLTSASARNATVSGLHTLLKHYSRPKIPLLACTCEACTIQKSSLVAQQGDIVTKLPRTALPILCRPDEAAGKVACIACLRDSDPMDVGGSFLYCTASVPIIPAATLSHDRKVSWKLTWHDIFEVCQRSQIGAPPGRIQRVGHGSHNTWL